MIDKDVLCQKICELYPDIGECDIDVKAEYDREEKAWVVHLQRDNQELKTFLDDGDAEKCMLGKQCVGLGIMVAQLRANIEELAGDQAPPDPSVCTKAPELAEHQRFDDADDPCDDGRSG
jgi:hypothetical protein